MVMGDVRTEDPVLVRVHTENVTCDMFGSLIDDTGFQLHTALEKIAAAGQGVVLYLRQREHSLDLVNQLRTYARDAGKVSSASARRVWKRVTAWIAITALARRYFMTWACVVYNC